MNLKTLLTVAIAALTTLGAAAQPQNHHHTYVGDSNGDGHLDFSGAIIPGTLTFADTGTDYSDEGFFYHGILTPTALHGSNVAIAANPNGALSGTFVRQVLYGVTGPAGASFGFYELDQTSVTFSMVTGTTGGTGSFALTEADYFAIGDPYGHIHGRRYVATHSGEYTVTWALENSELVGTMNSLLNPDPSQRLFTQTFTAVPEPGTFALLAIAAILAFAASRQKTKTE
jgi:hypothetical protein